MFRNLLMVTISVALVLGFIGCGPMKQNGIDKNYEMQVKRGSVILYSTKNYKLLDKAKVGSLPDMIKFTSDGVKLVVANEGEPTSDYKSDPLGSVSIISLNSNKVQNITTLDFNNFNISKDVRIKPHTDVARDLEPEYVAINQSNTKAWVTLQENNAVAIIDLEDEQIEKVISLGRVNLSNQYIDLMDDKMANLTYAPKNVYALYQPDSIVSYNVNGNDYIVTANEGDDREYDAWEDYVKIKDVKENLSSEFKPILDTKMKNLRILKDMGKINGKYEELYIAGTRSFSIRDTSGKLLFDSGAQFEHVIAKNFAKYFNTRVDKIKSNDSEFNKETQGKKYFTQADKAYFWEGLDARSLKKGIEPEALSIIRIKDRFFAYIGLEKQGGFFVYDITDPKLPFLVEYNNDINYNETPDKSGDLSPEGMVTFKQDGKNYLAIANELSSTVSLYELKISGKAKKLVSLKIGTFGTGAAEILDYCSLEKKLFVTNNEKKRIEVLDVSIAKEMKRISSIDFSKFGESVQSVSVAKNILAIAVN